MDNVSHPSHYNFIAFEVIDVIVESLGLEGARLYCQGNIIKYQTRYRFKNGDEDLCKRHWYSTMDRLLSECKNIDEYYALKKFVFVDNDVKTKKRG